MAQNITIAGASYSDVPSIQVPKTSSGTALFVDTSETTATADTMLSGSGAYGADGNWMSGTINATAVDYILARVALDGFDYATDYSSASTALGGE